MITITVEEPDDSAWIAWRKRCAKEQQSLDAATEVWRLTWATTPPPHDAKAKASAKPRAKRSVYTAQKSTFYVVSGPPFWGKCTYCESKILTGMHGDIDHFRPKGAVTNRDGTKVHVEIDGVEQEHPGYFWLAYDWHNLVPSCQLCNQPSRSQRSSERIGMWDYFPVIGDVRARKPGEEVNEQPLLINPLWEEPATHLGLTAEGVMYSKTKRGEACIDVFGLNKRDLPHERANVYDNTRRFVNVLRKELEREPNSEHTRALLGQLQRLKAGYEPYTMAARLAIADSRDSAMRYVLSLNDT